MIINVSKVYIFWDKWYFCNKTSGPGRAAKFKIVPRARCWIFGRKLRAGPGCKIKNRAPGAILNFGRKIRAGLQNSKSHPGRDFEFWGKNPGRAGLQNSKSRPGRDFEFWWKDPGRAGPGSKIQNRSPGSILNFGEKTINVIGIRKKLLGIRKILLCSNNGSRRKKRPKSKIWIRANE